MERWLVVDARIENHGVDKITFFCDPRRPAVQLPAVGSRVRWEFMQLPGESVETLLRDETLQSLLAPFVDYSKVEIERRAVYAFHARVVDKWRVGRVLLPPAKPFVPKRLLIATDAFETLDLEIAAALAPSPLPGG